MNYGTIARFLSFSIEENEFTVLYARLRCAHRCKTHGRIFMQLRVDLLFAGASEYRILKYSREYSHANTK